MLRALLRGLSPTGWMTSGHSGSPSIICFQYKHACLFPVRYWNQERNIWPLDFVLEDSLLEFSSIQDLSPIGQDYCSIRNWGSIWEEEQGPGNQKMTSFTILAHKKHPTADAISLIIIIWCHQFQKFPREEGNRKVSATWNMWMEFNRRW